MSKRTSRALHRKYFGESWLLWMAIAIGVCAFCWLRVRAVSRLNAAQFRQIIDAIPDDWQRFVTVEIEWLISYLGRTASTLDEPMLLTLLAGWAIARGSDVVSGELGRGTMEMLLSQPVSRKRVYWTHALWTLVGGLLLVLLTWLTMSIVIWTTSVTEVLYPEVGIWHYRFPIPIGPGIKKVVPLSSEISAWMFFPGIVNLLTMLFFVSGFAALCSSLDRFRWRTLGILIGVWFASAGLKILGVSTEGYRWIAHLSFFGFYSPANAIESTESNWHQLFWIFRYNAEGQIVDTNILLNNVVLLLGGAFCYWFGARVFLRRDLPAPV